jgi:hypothetical protein
MNEIIKEVKDAGREFRTETKKIKIICYAGTVIMSEDEDNL